MTPQQAYLEEIKRKLDAMNKQAGFDPKQAKSQRKDPDAIDIFSALGDSAIRYMQSKKEQK
jgi:hypothetical protein